MAESSSSSWLHEYHSTFLSSAFPVGAHLRKHKAFVQGVSSAMLSLYIMPFSASPRSQSVATNSTHGHSTETSGVHYTVCRCRGTGPCPSGVLAPHTSQTDSSEPSFSSSVGGSVAPLRFSLAMIPCSSHHFGLHATLYHALRCSPHLRCFLYRRNNILHSDVRLRSELHVPVPTDYL